MILLYFLLRILTTMSKCSKKIDNHSYLLIYQLHPLFYPASFLFWTDIAVPSHQRHHQLQSHMANKKNVWTPQEEQILFSAHAQLGSKWATIATRIPSKDQASIKNKFYSTLRRGFRKINTYITEVKRKSDPVRFRAFKTLQEIFISKLMAVVDGSHQEKYEVKPTAVTLAAGIETLLIEIACSQNEYDQGEKQEYSTEEELLQKILEFNKNCKKRKGKRTATEKRKSNKQIEEEEQQSQNEPESKPDEEEKKEQQNYLKNEQHVEEKEEYKVESSSFLSRMEKKESTSTIVKSFSDYADHFFTYCQGISSRPIDENTLIQSANCMTHSGFLRDQKTGWMYQSTSSRFSQPKMLSNYLTQPSPSPNDPFSPFSFSNIIKNNNITGSTMFNDKISCNEEEMAKSNAYQKDLGGQMPLEKVKTGEFLIKSADLQRELNQEAPSLSVSMRIEKETMPTCTSILQHINGQHFLNNSFSSFTKEYAFEITQNDSNPANLLNAIQEEGSCL